MTEQTLFQLALDLYTPPFTFNKYGYLNDSSHQMVADNHVEDSVEETGKEAVLRVRGWGRISYLPDPEKLQDQVGAILGQALTEFWLKYKGVECLEAVPKPDRYDAGREGDMLKDGGGDYVKWSDFQYATTIANAAVNHINGQADVITHLHKELQEAKAQLSKLQSKPTF